MHKTFFHKICHYIYKVYKIFVQLWMNCIFSKWLVKKKSFYWENGGCEYMQIRKILYMRTYVP